MQRFGRLCGIVEPANLVSMTIINSNEDYLSLVGSDVQDWSEYNSSMALEIKFSIDSFSKFYELAKEPKIFVKKLIISLYLLNG